MGHPGQQGGYVTQQMMTQQQTPQSMSYAYQQPGQLACLIHLAGYPLRMCLLKDFTGTLKNVYG